MKIQGTIKLKYLQHWVDHLGRHRYRIRRNGQRIELKVNSEPSSPAFLEAYYGALRVDHMVAAVSRASAAGSVRDAVERYLSSTTFADYSTSTQSLRRPIFNRLLAVAGAEELVKMDRAYIERWLETASTKGAKRTLLLALKPFLEWAVQVQLLRDDPSASVRAQAHTTEGHHTWTEEEIAQYRARHGLGSMARLALELMLNVGSRRGDTVTLGPQHLKQGVLSWTAEKNSKRKPVAVSVPMLPELTAAIAACPLVGAHTFLVTARGKPFSKSDFGRWFGAQVAAAGLPEHCTAHGLRKAAITRLALHGATTNELMAFAGHATLQEADRYTKKANRVRLAAQAVARLKETTG